MASLKQPSSSSETQKSLYMFISFYEGPYLYTLYHFIINTTYTKHQKPSLHPNNKLNFRREKYPIGMGCIALDSKVYFIGGQFERDGNIYYSKTVYMLDLDTEKRCLNDGKKLELIEGPKMHSGKSNPLAVAVAGRIYVLSLPFYGDKTDEIGLRDFERMREGSKKAKNDYEVFDTRIGQWTVLPNHPFGEEKCVLGHVVVGDIIYFLTDKKYKYSFHGEITKETPGVYCFDMQKQRWVGSHKLDHYNFALHSTFNCCKDYGYRFGGRGIVVNDTLYGPGYGTAIRTYNLSNKNMKGNCVPFDAVRGLEFSLGTRLEYYPGGSELFMEADLVHLGDEKFCLVSYENRSEHYWRMKGKNHSNPKRDVTFTIFQVIKQKSQGENFMWADIVDSYAIEEVDAELGRLCYCFTS